MESKQPVDDDMIKSNALEQIDEEDQLTSNEEET